MAQGGLELTAAYPLPPIYYKRYTSQNITLHGQGQPIIHNNEIINLNPPEPVNEPLTVFGSLLDVIHKHDK